MRVVRHYPTRTILCHFDGCAEYADMVRTRIPTLPSYYPSGWVGETYDDTLRRAKEGDTTLVPQAEALIERLTVDAQRESRQWVADRAGAYPVVPDYLMGRPENMRRLTPQRNDRAPIKMYVGLDASAGVSAPDMVKRGTAILALALLLNAERAVEIHTLVGLDTSLDGYRGAFCVVPLGTSPLDIAVACNALTSVGFWRSMGFQFLQQSPETKAVGGWEWGISPDTDALRRVYVARLREALCATAEDIIIPAVSMNDPSVRDPLGFVQRSLADALKIEEQDA